MSRAIRIRGDDLETKRKPKKRNLAEEHSTSPTSPSELAVGTSHPEILFAIFDPDKAQSEAKRDCTRELFRFGANKLRLFFPICHCKHWFLFVVDLQNHLFAFMDSLYSKKSRYQVVVSDLLVCNFKHLWKELVDPDYSFDNFRIVYPDIPRQGNGNDCGVFVMKCMEIWTPRVVLHDYFSRVNIPNIRIQYANQLFFSSKNTADKSLVTNFFGEGKFHRARKGLTSDSYQSRITRTEDK